MLSDRPYMRRDYPRETTSGTVWLLAIFVSAYVVQLLLALGWLAGGSDATVSLLLTVRSLQLGHVWTLLTHALVQPTSNPLPFAFTLLTLFLVARELEPHLGMRRLLAVFTGATFAGALAWTAVHYRIGGMHFGPGAAILGMAVVLACLYPEQEINFLAFFVIPVRLQPRYLLLGLAVLDAAGLIAFELTGRDVPLGLTPSAHLGGMLAGWLFFRYFHARGGWDRASVIRAPVWLGWLRRRPTPAPPPSAETGHSPEVIRAEVDRILDKINSHGFGALTDEEKQLLDEAKDLLSKH